MGVMNLDADFVSDHQRSLRLTCNLYWKQNLGSKRSLEIVSRGSIDTTDWEVEKLSWSSFPLRWT